MTSLYVICWRVTKWSSKSGGNYTHPANDKVMPPSQFLIRFMACSLIYVNEITFKALGNHQMNNLFRNYSQIPTAELLFFQTISAIVCFGIPLRDARQDKISPIIFG